MRFDFFVSSRYYEKLFDGLERDMIRLVEHAQVSLFRDLVKIGVAPPSSSNILKHLMSLNPSSYDRPPHPGIVHFLLDFVSRDELCAVNVESFLIGLCLVLILSC